MTTLDPRALNDADAIESALRVLRDNGIDISSPPPCWWIDHGSHGQITQREDEANRAFSDGKFVVRYAISALSVAPATADGWRTMEDAPKDGTSILAAHRQAAIVVQWYEDRCVDGAPGWGDGETDLDGYFYTYPVTHWRQLPPLPAAPTATGGR